MVVCIPDAAAVYCLLGKLWHAHNNNKKAVDCFVEALKLNPFMWDAFVELCAMGNRCTSAILVKANGGQRCQHSDIKYFQVDAGDAGSAINVNR